MKRFLMLVGVAVVAAAMYVAAAPGSQQAKGPTARQFNALKKQVASLSKSLKLVTTQSALELKVLGDCVQVAVPINQFGDPDGSLSGTDQGFIYGKGGTPAAPTTSFFTTGLDVTSTDDTGAAWFVGAIGATGGAKCSADLGNGGNALRHAAAKAGIRLPRASSLRPSFTAHRP
jgi:hypothetical protein